MRITSLFFLTTLSVVILSACASTQGGGYHPSNSKDKVAVTDILDSVKCGMGIYLRDRDKANAKFKVNDGTANLFLTDVKIVAEAIEGGVTFPVLGINLGPSASRARSRTSTDITQFTFGFDLSDSAEYGDLTKICAKNEGGTENHKLANILIGYGNSINKVEPGDPTFTATNFIIDTRFQLDIINDVQLGIDFFIVETTTQRRRTLRNAQRLLITFGVEGTSFFAR